MFKKLKNKETNPTAKPTEPVKTTDKFIFKGTTDILSAEKIKNGQDVVFRVNGMGKQTFNGTIVSIEQAVSDKDYSIKVYVRTKGEVPAFRPGMYVRARLKD